MDNDIYTVIDVQDCFGQQVLNVYHYRQSGVGSSQASTLADAWWALFGPYIVAIQHALITHVEIDVQSHEDLTDFYVKPLTADNVGTVSGDGMPPYVSWGFEYLRSTRAVRNGGKRIGGVPEGQVGNGVAVSGILAALGEVRDCMADTITVGDILFEPLIVHKLPVEPFTWTGYGITGVEYKGVGTQNTRKFGRGA